MKMRGYVASLFAILLTSSALADAPQQNGFMPAQSGAGSSPQSGTIVDQGGSLHYQTAGSPGANKAPPQMTPQMQQQIQQQAQQQAQQQMPAQPAGAPAADSTSMNAGQGNTIPTGAAPSMPTTPGMSAQQPTPTPAH